MKVVLFCGGRGVRLRRKGCPVPKPLVRIGTRPILWHVMKYYAHYGHKDFILCLGYKAERIKRFFLTYDERTTNDFTFADGGRDIALAQRDIADWRITFVDTGLDANIGERLRAVRDHLAGEETFLANYSDGLTDVHLPSMIETFERSAAIASFVSVRPQQSFHVVRSDLDGFVTGIDPMSGSDVRINGGYFVLRREIFEYLREGEELVVEPFARLVEKRRLLAHRHEGFWASMDTFKDKQMLERLHAEREARWQVWRHDAR